MQIYYEDKYKEGRSVFHVDISRQEAGTSGECQILSGAQAATDLRPSGSVFNLPSNSVLEAHHPLLCVLPLLTWRVQLSTSGGSPGAPHPFHLHGHNFFVVKSAGNDTYNFDNPIIQDVANTGTETSDDTTIRFVTDDAGPWILHCHIDFHLKLGLAIVFAEDNGTVAQSGQTTQWDALRPPYDALLSDEV
ncbi:multicopper oxidase-domain-containing protein [Mycena vulgaris]|nr:multicopper oxidase-domain-containing protein [Mycena vulgaris]